MFFRAVSLLKIFFYSIVFSFHSMYIFCNFSFQNDSESFRMAASLVTLLRIDHSLESFFGKLLSFANVILRSYFSKMLNILLILLRNFQCDFMHLRLSIRCLFKMPSVILENSKNEAAYGLSFRHDFEKVLISNSLLTSR